MDKDQKKDLLRIVTAAILFLIALLLRKPEHYAFLFFLPAYFLAGYEVFLETGKSVIHCDLLDEDFLMTVASLGAFIIGEYPEAVAVLLLFEIGEWFEDLAVEKSRHNISRLTGLRPETARVIREGKAAITSPDDVRIGEIILIQPGERVPLDGIIIEGLCELDNSALTGESIPLSVSPGDAVSSGSVVLNKLIYIKTTKLLEDSTASRIIRLVEESENLKSKSEAFITKFARVYTPVVCIAALILAIVPSLFTGEWKTWAYRGLLFLVVSCPCALVVSVPLSFFAGIGGAAKRGVLIKGGQFIEVLSKANCIIFDKTGTLTDGKLTIKGIIPAANVLEFDLLALTASAEQYSSHPIAKCICASAPSLLPASDVSEIAGQGVSALVEGKHILAGNKKMAKANGQSIDMFAETDGTAVYTFADGSYMGKIIVGDLPKSNAAEAIRRLKSIGIEETGLLTGDTNAAGKHLAEVLGLSFCNAELMPQDKVFTLEKVMKAAPERVTLYVGDGINDAPVLARADAGIAMGALGSDAAIEAADIVLMDDDPLKLPLAISHARKTMLIVKQNICFSLIVKIIVLLLGAFGKTNMWLAVFADVGVTALAVLNAIRCFHITE